VVFKLPEIFNYHIDREYFLKLCSKKKEEYPDAMVYINY